MSQLSLLGAIKRNCTRLTKLQSEAVTKLYEVREQAAAACGSSCAYATKAPVVEVTLQGEEVAVESTTVVSLACEVQSTYKALEFGCDSGEATDVETAASYSSGARIHGDVSLLTLRTSQGSKTDLLSRTQ